VTDGNTGRVGVRPTVAYRWGMNAPTASDIRAWAPPDFPWAKLGWTAPGSGTDPLQKRVDWAIGYVETTTWRPVATIVPPDQPGNLPMVETGAQINLVPVAEQAVMLALLQQIAQQSKGYFNATVLKDYIRSFSAGSYSETREAAQDVLRNRGSVQNPLVNRWRELSDLLYLLMTPDAFDYWRFRLTGTAAPAAAMGNPDFGPSRGGMGPLVWGGGVENVFPWSW
jgi:hypothetical protein